MLRSRRLAPSHYSDSQFKSKGVNTKKTIHSTLVRTHHQSFKKPGLASRDGSSYYSYCWGIKVSDINPAASQARHNYYVQTQF
jgi:hypothetical protein